MSMPQYRILCQEEHFSTSTSIKKDFVCRLQRDFNMPASASSLLLKTLFFNQEALKACCLLYSTSGVLVNVHLKSLPAGPPSSPQNILTSARMYVLSLALGSFSPIIVMVSPPLSSNTPLVLLFTQQCALCSVHHWPFLCFHLSGSMRVKPIHKRGEKGWLFPTIHQSISFKWPCNYWCV